MCIYVHVCERGAQACIFMCVHKHICVCVCVCVRGAQFDTHICCAENVIWYGINFNELYRAGKTKNSYMFMDWITINVLWLSRKLALYTHCTLIINALSIDVIIDSIDTYVLSIYDVKPASSLMDTYIYKYNTLAIKIKTFDIGTSSLD